MPDHGLEIGLITRLVTEMDRQKMTQTRLSQLSGVPQATLSRVIRGERGMSVGSWTKLFRVLRVREVIW